MRIWVRVGGLALTFFGVVFLFNGSVNAIIEPSPSPALAATQGFVAASLSAIAVLYRAVVDVQDAGRGRLRLSISTVVIAFILAIALAALLSATIGVDASPTLWMWVGFFATLLPPVIEDAFDRVLARATDA